MHKASCYGRDKSRGAIELVSAALLECEFQDPPRDAVQGQGHVHGLRLHREVYPEEKRQWGAPNGESANGCVGVWVLCVLVLLLHLHLLTPFFPSRSSSANFDAAT